MVDPGSGRVQWFSPDPRCVLPLNRLHVPRRLARTIRQGRFEITQDRDFPAVIRACAKPRMGRESTWLDERLIETYVGLHHLGHAQSVEAWRGGRLVGGLYGVRIGAAFFAESMFCIPADGGTDASKICLVRLAELLRSGGFRLLDVQFRTAHLARFGCIEIPRRRYLNELALAVDGTASWPAPSGRGGTGDPRGEKKGAGVAGTRVPPSRG